METRELVEENARILRGIQRSQRASMIFRLLYWLVIIGISVGAFWFIQPYINSLKDSVGSIESLYN